MYVYLQDSQETEAPGSQELFDQDTEHDRTVPVSEKLLKDIPKHTMSINLIKRPF